jgi:N-acetylmuramoyl-L-alanine amidase
MKIDNHKLTDDPRVKEVSSPNHGGVFAAGHPDTIVIHFTAGSSAASSVKSLCDDKSPNRASAHLVIGRDSSITQLVPFNTVAWHAGKSQHNGRTGFNQYSIGIEIDNAGELTKTGEKYLSWFGKEYPVNEVVHLKHRNHDGLRYWHTYTEDQIVIVEEICKLLLNAYPIRFILGHEEISPTRKTDPGPAFPLDNLRDELLNQVSDDGAEDLLKQGKVTAEILNLRVAPENGDVLLKLPKETQLKILEEKEGWLKVVTEQIGWVKKDFVSAV